jgi:hypothetical protein
LIRLAHLAEDRALQELGKNRARVEQTQTWLSKLAADLATTRVGAILAPSARMAAGPLAAAAHRGRAIQVSSDGLRERLVEALEAEEKTRLAVIDAKLRLRTLQRVATKREVHERAAKRRTEIRRMDEIQRGLRPEGGS